MLKFISIIMLMAVGFQGLNAASAASGVVEWNPTGDVGKKYRRALKSLDEGKPDWHDEMYRATRVKGATAADKRVIALFLADKDVLDNYLDLVNDLIVADNLTGADKRVIALFLSKKNVLDKYPDLRYFPFVGIAYPGPESALTQAQRRYNEALEEAKVSSFWLQAIHAAAMSALQSGEKDLVGRVLATLDVWEYEEPLKRLKIDIEKHQKAGTSAAPMPPSFGVAHARAAPGS
jgi:hypothetical protein